MNDIEIQQMIKLLKLFRNQTITYGDAVKLLSLTAKLYNQLDDEIDYYNSQNGNEDEDD